MSIPSYRRVRAVLAADKQQAASFLTVRVPEDQIVKYVGLLIKSETGIAVPASVLKKVVKEPSFQQDFGRELAYAWGVLIKAQPNNEKQEPLDLLMGLLGDPEEEDSLWVKYGIDID